MKKFIAVQLGAARSYATPNFLEQSGMLYQFYTDLCGNHGTIGALLKFLPEPLQLGYIRNLIGRQLPDNLVSKTTTFPLLSFNHFFKKKLARENEVKANLALKELSETMGEAIIKQNWGNANYYFSMLGECTPALRYAKQKGMITITEIFITLNAYKYVEKEYQKYPDLGKPINQELLSDALEWLQEICNLSDWFIAPSEAVKDDLVNHWGVKEEYCIVIPYGIENSWLDIANNPISGKILMVGTADLRKGIHILGLASKKIENNGNYEFRVCGNVSDEIKKSQITDKLIFLGRVPRIDIKKEFQSADIFVLPSVAEGSALVTYEALACGIPVITTKAAGSVVRDGIDGFIVPEGDADALADKIQLLVEDRSLRNQMAVSAKERAKDFTWDKYGQRLLSFFQSI